MLYSSYAGQSIILRKRNHNTQLTDIAKQPCQFLITTNTLFINVFLEKVYCFMLVAGLTFIQVMIYMQKQLMLYLKLPELRLYIYI